MIVIVKIGNKEQNYFLSCCDNKAFEFGSDGTNSSVLPWDKGERQYNIKIALCFGFPLTITIFICFYNTWTTARDYVVKSFRALKIK